MDAFKRETMVGYTVWEINADKRFYKSRSRHKDAARVKRNARRKYRRELKKVLDNESAE